MERYDVYLYDLPKVEEEKLLAPGRHEKRDFPTEEAAKAFMEQNRSSWERIVLIKTTGDAQQRVLRYRDGEIEPFPAPPQT